MTKKIITDALFLSIEQLLKKYKPDQLAGLALYSDESAMTLVFSANTKKNLDEAKKNDPDDFTYYRWSPEEWKAEKFKDIEIQKISRLLLKNSAKQNEINFVKFRNTLFESSVESLKLARIHFKELKHCIFVFNVSDFNQIETEINWIKKLNSKKDSLEFENWLRNLNDEDLSLDE